MLAEQHFDSMTGFDGRITMRAVYRLVGLCCAVAVAVVGLCEAQGQSIFADKNLEAVVRQYVFEKRNSDAPLTEEDVKTISTIAGKNKGITNLAGLEKCRALALLDLSGNQIEDLTALKDLKNLQSLDLSKNRITNITPLAGLTGLQYLNLADNQISDISALENMTNLRTLYLSNNQVTDLSVVGKLTKVWSLYVDGNKISDLTPVAGLRYLSSLDVRNNRIEDLSPLSGLTELRYLMLDNNQVKDLAILVDMVKRDAEGEKRFAPFLRVYLAGNPLSEEAKTQQIDTLRKFGCRVIVE
jgi:internalin A